MKRIIIFIIITSIETVFLNAQVSIVAVKEKVSTILIGTGTDKVSYSLSEEGLYSSEGPMVDKDGRLLFYPSTTRDKLRSFYKGKWEAFPLFKFLEKTTGNQIQFISQQGMIMVRETIYVLDPGYGSFYFSADMGRSIPITNEYCNYIMPFGGYIESKRPIFSFSTEVLRDRTLKVRDLEETRSWLSTQPGGFTIGDDGLLYRNGMLWSATKKEGMEGIYIGKLISGHNLYCAGDKIFRVTNARGDIELMFEFPWGTDTDKGIFQPFNYGLGPWGELYCLIPPRSMWMTEPALYGGLRYVVKPTKDISEPAELVVVRNHLKYFGRLNADRVRLRKEPNTTSDIVGTYPVKTGFRIVETGAKKETIGDKTDVWYKVRLLDGTEGWFFGAFVANLYDGPGTPPPWPNVADW